MIPVRIAAAAAAHPETRINQDEAAGRIAAAAGNERRVRALARGTGVESRATIISAEQIASLGTIEERNDIYRRKAPRLALEAARKLDICRDAVSFLSTSSCTGYMAPGLDVELAQALHLPPTATRLPITEAGCAGGVVAIARAFDYLSTKPGSALVAAVELCSLAFHCDSDEGNLTSALLFADGAGAALLESGGRDGLYVVDTQSMLVPGTQDLLGFDLTDNGFYPLLSRRLPDRLPEPTVCALGEMLERHGLRREEVDFWLVHPGGPRVLEALQKRCCLRPQQLRWSWDVLHESGNTSSAAIIEVIARYLGDPVAPGGWGVAIAFGPGVSIEMLLLRRC